MYKVPKSVLSLYIVILMCMQFTEEANAALETTQTKNSLINRLKRNSKDEISSGILYKDDLNAFVEYLQENPWILAEAQKRQMPFTPRLGRDLGEENIDRWAQDSDFSDLKSLRALQFVPRLGKRARYFGHYEHYA